MRPLSSSQRGPATSAPHGQARLTSLPDPFAEAPTQQPVASAQQGQGGAPQQGYGQPGAPQQGYGQPGASARQAHAPHGASARQTASQATHAPQQAPQGAVRAGYRAPVANPYTSGDRPLGRAAQGLQPAWQKDDGRKKGAALRALLIVVCVFAAVGGIWLVAWLNRSVTFTLNGSEAAVKVGSTLEQVIADKDLSYTPGNLVSVSGKLLKEGEGEPFSATLNDQQLTWDQIQDVRIEGDENVTLGNGADITEDYTSTTETIEPKLVMEGNWGAVAYVSQWGKPGVSETRVGSISGETVEGQVTEEPQDCVITVTNPVPADGQKLVALTFDDGPSAYTQKYLDILAQYGAKATFFNLGTQVASDPEGAKAIVDSGNQLASHTTSHEQLPNLTPEQLQSELTTAFDDIKNATGVSTTVIRPPYGDFSERTWLNSGGLMSASILWNQDSEDWRLPGVDSIVEKSLAGVTSGSIILMHDGGGNRDQDLQALPRIIEALQNDGYKLVTIDELLQSDPNIPDDIATGDATLPEGCVWPTELGDA